MKKTIRILAAGGIGDVLLLTPVLKEIRRLRPTCRVIVYCRDRVRTEVLARNPNVDAVRLISPLDRFLHFTKILDGRYLYFTKVTDSGFIDYGQLGMLMPHIFYSHSISKIIGEVIGVNVSRTDVEIFLSGEEEARGQKSLIGLTSPVAISVTGVGSPNKNWPIEKWKALVRSMSGVSFFQLGLPDEPLIEGVIDMRGLPLRESFARLKFASAFVGVDSGLAHAASGFNVPAIVLFGPTNPAVVGHQRNTNIYHKARCSPCFDILLDAPCPYGRHCMHSITIEEVRTALTSILDTKTFALPALDRAM
jgi:ADP-heptose:LPS heptosyltransferase